MALTVPRSRALLALALAASLTGCVSTEQKAAWLHVQNARIVASSDPTFVTARSAQVWVDRVISIGRAGRLAIVVSLHNTSAQPVNDIPVTVGLRGPGRRVTYLNTAAGLDYFRNHIAEIPAHASLSWVFVTVTRPWPGAQAFAVAGIERKLGIPAARVLPRLRANVTRRAAPGGAVTVAVTNLSGIPQADVPVYILARQSGRALAAGSGALISIAAGHTATTTVDLVGQPGGVPLEVEALPTLF